MYPKQIPMFNTTKPNLNRNIKIQGRSYLSKLGLWQVSKWWYLLSFILDFMCCHFSANILEEIKKYYSKTLFTDQLCLQITVVISSRSTENIVSTHLKQNKLRFYIYQAIFKRGFTLSERILNKVTFYVSSSTWKWKMYAENQFLTYFSQLQPTFILFPIISIKK